MLIDLVADEGKSVLVESRDLVARLVRIRKRFEVWHHLETYKRLLHGHLELSVEVERLYPGTQERCDFWMREDDKIESWIELKCCVTNYCQGYTAAGSIRPITNQIDEIIRDRSRLFRLFQSGAYLHILLLVYPMPFNYPNHSPWSSHLNRLRSAGMRVDEAFSVSVDFAGKTTNIVGYRCDVQVLQP